MPQVCWSSRRHQQVRTTYNLFSPPTAGPSSTLHLDDDSCAPRSSLLSIHSARDSRKTSLHSRLKMTTTMFKNINGHRFSGETLRRSGFRARMTAETTEKSEFLPHALILQHPRTRMQSWIDSAPSSKKLTNAFETTRPLVRPNCSSRWLT